MKSKVHYKYIVGLKGIACVGIMLCHYLAVVASSKEGLIGECLSAIYNSPIKLFLDGELWNHLFAVVSGFLVAKVNIESFLQLICRCIKRFLRFAFPILFAACYIYILFLFVGIHNASTASLFDNAWYQRYYPVFPSFEMIIKAPIAVLFEGDSYINGPYWMLQDIFFASVLIYIFRYLMQKLKGLKVLQLLLVVALAMILIQGNKIIFSCGIGALICMNIDKVSSIVRKMGKGVLALPIILIILYYFKPGNVLATIFWGTAIVYFTAFEKVSDCMFSHPIFRWLGMTSFGIYSFHWPVFCSVGGLIMLHSIPVIGITNGKFVASIVCVVISVGLAWIYSVTAEKWAVHLTECICNLKNTSKRVTLK